MSDNPFQAPLNQPGQNYGPQGVPPSLGRGYVKQVSVIAILMIVQGALLLFFALIMIGYAIFVSRMDEFMPVDQQAADMQEMMEMQKVFTIVFVVVSGCGGLLGIMHFVAAYFGFNYKYRVFGIITMILGLSSMMTFYCAPTAIGLAVYGLIIYFNPAVAKAFQLRKTGTKKQEILGHFPY